MCDEPIDAMKTTTAAKPATDDRETIDTTPLQRIRALRVELSTPDGPDASPFQTAARGHSGVPHFANKGVSDAHCTRVRDRHSRRRRHDHRVCPGWRTVSR